MMSSLPPSRAQVVLRAQCNPIQYNTSQNLIYISNIQYPISNIQYPISILYPLSSKSTQINPKDTTKSV